MQRDTRFNMDSKPSTVQNDNRNSLKRAVHNTAEQFPVNIGQVDQIALQKSRSKELIKSINLSTSENNNELNSPEAVPHLVTLTSVVITFLPLCYIFVLPYTTLIYIVNTSLRNTFYRPTTNHN